MTTDEYEDNVIARASGDTTKVDPLLVHGAMGLCEEAGEVSSYIRKAMFYGKHIDKQKLLLELGDAMWFLTLTTMALGSSIKEIMELNDAKLQARFGGTKFDAEKAINKDEKKEAKQLPLFNDLRDTLGLK